MSNQSVTTVQQDQTDLAIYYKQQQVLEQRFQEQTKHLNEATLSMEERQRLVKEAAQTLADLRENEGLARDLEQLIEEKMDRSLEVLHEAQRQQFWEEEISHKPDIKLDRDR